MAQQDFDGTISFSKIRTVLFDGKTKPIVYPNPVKLGENLNLQLNAEQTIIVSIHNITGQVIQESVHDIFSGSGNISINTAELSEGIYTLSINVDGKMENVKFIITN